MLQKIFLLYHLNPDYISNNHDYNFFFLEFHNDLSTYFPIK